MKNKFLISVFAVLFLVTLVGAGDYKFQNQKIYKLDHFNYINMFPSDPTGSLDEFSSLEVENE
jgi:hypothetical protein